MEKPQSASPERVQHKVYHPYNEQYSIQEMVVGLAQQLKPHNTDTRQGCLTYFEAGPSFDNAFQGLYCLSLALKKQIFDLKCKADELTKSLETEQINLEEKSFENERLQDEVIALNFSLDDKNQQIDCLNHLIDELKRKVDSLTGSQSTGRKNQKIINFGSYVNKRKIKRIIGVRKKRRQNSK